MSTCGTAWERNGADVKGRVLVVDDDLALAEMLGIVLRNEGLEVDHSPTAPPPSARSASSGPTWCSSTSCCPGIDGLEVCRQIRAESGVPDRDADRQDRHRRRRRRAWSPAPTTTSSSRSSRKELIARVRARLRRGDEPEPEPLTIGDLAIDVAGHSVTRDGGQVSLTPLEFDLLVALARKPWQVFTREVLLEQVWGYRHAGDTRLVNVHVQRLRSKIEHDPEHPEIVVTVRGVGYKAGRA